MKVVLFFFTLALLFVFSLTFEKRRIFKSKFKNPYFGFKPKYHKYKNFQKKFKQFTKEYKYLENYFEKIENLEFYHEKMDPNLLFFRELIRYASAPYYIGKSVYNSLKSIGTKKETGTCSVDKSSSNGNNCNGKTALCNKRFDQVSFATTHNSHATKSSFIYANQELSITQQIDLGVRGFMIDVYKNKYLDSTLYACHAKSKAPLCYFTGELKKFKDILEEIRKGMIKYRNDVFTIILESYVSADEVIKAFKDACLDQYAYEYTPAGSQWPTLKTMIDKNKRLVILSDKTEQTQTKWYIDTYSVAKENPFSIKSPSELSCAIDRGKNCANNCLWILNMFKTNSVLPSIPSYGDEMNANPGLKERVEKCRKEWNHIPNFIAVDWVNKGNLMDVISELNK